MMFHWKSRIENHQYWMIDLSCRETVTKKFKDHVVECVNLVILDCLCNPNAIRNLSCFLRTCQSVELNFAPCRLGEVQSTFE